MKNSNLTTFKKRKDDEIKYVYCKHLYSFLSFVYWVFSDFNETREIYRLNEVTYSLSWTRSKRKITHFRIFILVFFADVADVSINLRDTIDLRRKKKLKQFWDLRDIVVKENYAAKRLRIRFTSHLLASYVMWMWCEFSKIETHITFFVSWCEFNRIIQWQILYIL